MSVEAASASFAGVDDSVVDDLRAALTAGGSDPVPGLIRLFLDDAHRRFGEIVDAIATGDARALARATHALKGSASTFGAVRLARLSGRLQGVVSAGPSADWGRHARVLEHEIRLVRQHFLGPELPGRDVPAAPPGAHVSG